ncbi:hypothetical protein GCM10010293_07910 [Streptomyces griseoflavus]|nr:hypothetical protein GCM10010293_07910 [Streptomyces griseoflavus]
MAELPVRQAEPPRERTTLERGREEEGGCAEAGLGGPNAFACSREAPRRPGPLVYEGSALAVDLAAHGLVLTRGTPPRTEGCRTAGRGLMAVTHDLGQETT